MTFEDIIKSSLYAFIILVCITIGGLLFFNSVVNRSCEALHDISSNEILADEIFHTAQIYLHKPHYYSQASQKHGVLFVRDLDDNLNVDWDKAGIPLRIATIDIRGKNINYKSILPKQVEEILTDIKSDKEYSEVELQIALEHAYHHLNYAWNIRNIEESRAEACSKSDYKAWSKFPAKEFTEYE